MQLKCPHSFKITWTAPSATRSPAASPPPSPTEAAVTRALGITSPALVIHGPVVVSSPVIVPLTSSPMQGNVSTPAVTVSPLVANASTTITLSPTTGSISPATAVPVAAGVQTPPVAVSPRLAPPQGPPPTPPQQASSGALVPSPPSTVPSPPQAAVSTQPPASSVQTTVSPATSPAATLASPPTQSSGERMFILSLCVYCLPTAYCLLPFSGSDCSAFLCLTVAHCCCIIATAVD